MKSTFIIRKLLEESIKGNIDTIKERKIDHYIDGF